MAWTDWLTYWRVVYLTNWKYHYGDLLADRKVLMADKKWYDWKKYWFTGKLKKNINDWHEIIDWEIITYWLTEKNINDWLELIEKE
jgi:hypothetical protein